MKEKTKWKQLEIEKPELNQIIIYKGNLYGEKGRYMGETFVQLANGDIDEFDEWQPLPSPPIQTIKSKI